MKAATSFHIGSREISLQAPVYFIADIAANHDGDLQRAKDLIWRAKEAGADAAKFQHFLAKHIVSDYGFKNLGTQIGHQSGWKKSVYEIYEQYELNRDWNAVLAETCVEANIEFMTTPYDAEAIAGVDHLVRAYKIGSGDVTWTDFIARVARQGKPVLLATGASSIKDVERAVVAVLDVNPALCLMQCNTNYTGSLENFGFVNLRVLQAYAAAYPGVVLGLSDHTPGHATVLGAIAMGARVVEKHFTDDATRIGPDHGFSMTPATWREMVDRSRELQAALGDGIKKIEANERDTAIVQRRCVRLTRDMKAGDTISRADLECLRPAPLGAMEPHEQDLAIGRRLMCDKPAGDALFNKDLAPST